ncbi:MAG: glutamate carboxypeptidase [Saprospiraceae bacterium]|nr:MAG: glutamate carboxypeptidase [Saprospiraceae bacterium]
MWGLACASAALHAQSTEIPPLKERVIRSIERQFPEMVSLSDSIWRWAETAFLETRSANALAAFAEKNGFRVQRGVAQMPTAFIAEFGSGRPVIGILGEFDALPGLSQQVSPTKTPMVVGAPGHGCGHNLFGVASLAAAVAIKELIEDGALSGTIRFYGTPAEEKFFGKLFLAREGYFNDLDVCLDWHPSDETKANVQSSKAMIDFTVEFFGQAAHASSDPWNGRSALDGLELFTTGLNYMREHVKPTVRIHYQIQHGGAVVNVVPDYARVWVRIRDSKREGMMAVYEWAQKVAEGGALMAGVDYKINLVSGLHEVLPNRTGGTVMHHNLELLGPITYTPEEIEFAKAIQRNTGKPETGPDGSIKTLEETLEDPTGGSTDVGDVSWIVPEIRLSVTTAPKDVPWHSWAVVASGGMSIGHKGMSHAAKALAMTMVDLFQDENLRKAIREEFEQRRGDYQYKPILPDGPPPIEQAKAEAAAWQE